MKKEVKNEEFINPFMRLKYTAFTPSYFSAYLYGLCSVCVRHNKKIKKKNHRGIQVKICNFPNTKKIEKTLKDWR